MWVINESVNKQAGALEYGEGLMWSDGVMMRSSLHLTMMVHVL